MPPALLDAIRALLAEAECPFREIEHPAVRTAEEAAAVRGTPLAMGAKTILFKTDDRFRLFTFSAARELRSRLIRKELGVRRTRFATAAELRRLTGLSPGAVPPFGEPLLPFELCADPSLGEQEEIAFTPGVRDRSIVVASADWLRIARPRVFRFSRPAGAG